VLKYDACGQRSDTVRIVKGDCDCRIFIANVFSPRSRDQLNDSWKPLTCQTLEYDLKIFNRFGERVFHSQAPDLAWDGKFRGEVVQEGAYRYLLKVRTIHDQEVFREGWVTVMR
jgi:gliding motility-associated-like protein